MSAYVFWETVAPSAPPSPTWSLGVTDLWICVLIVTLPLDLSLVSHAVIDKEGSIVGVLRFGDFVDRSVCDGSICFEA